MTQRERVLRMLEEAGSAGIRSDECIKAYMPRAAARVKELREQGFQIEAEREGKFVRWTLNVGVGTEPPSEGGSGSASHALSVDSGVAASSSTSPPTEKTPEAPPATSMYDPFGAWS